MSEDSRHDPLPPDWLPEPAGPSEGSAAWEAEVRRVVEAAAPRLEARRSDDGAADPGGSGAWAGLGRLLRPAAGLAAAATLALFAVGPERADRPPSRSAALAAVASGGEPVALWRASGTEADPVLALIALEEEAP